MVTIQQTFCSILLISSFTFLRVFLKNLVHCPGPRYRNSDCYVKIRSQANGVRKSLRVHDVLTSAICRTTKIYRE